MSETHNLGKRSVTLEPSVLAAIVAGIVGFNLLIFAGWYIIKRRAKIGENGGEHGDSSFECGSLDETKSYTVASSRQSPTAPKEKQQHERSRPRPKTRVNKSRHGRAQEQLRETSTGSRSAEADSASVYSSASAPLEYHDLLFRTQPFSLDLTSPPTAPRWVIPKDSSHSANQGLPKRSLPILQSLMPSPPPTQDEPETISGLIDQIDQLNRRPSFSQTSSVASAEYEPVAALACVHLRTGTTASAVPPYSIDFAYIPNSCSGESRSSPAVTPPKGSSEADHSGSDLGNPNIPNTETHQCSFKSASQRLTSSPPRVIWKQ